MHNDRKTGRPGWRHAHALTGLVAAGIALLACASGPPALAQQPAPERPAEGTLIRRVDVEGLQSISEGFVRRLLKTRPGQNLETARVQEDVRELLRSRKFVNVTADTFRDDGQAVVVFRVREKPAVLTLEIDGNKAFTDEELFKELAFAAGSVLDRYEVDRGRENIQRKYKEKGYYYAEVALDEIALQAESRVLYRITEGPLVRVRQIRFEGASAFSELQLKTKVRTQTYLWILRAGAFDDEQAERDATELQSFYRGEGYLDARVGYRLDFDSVDRTRLIVVFVVQEGTRYRVGEITFEGAQAFDAEQLRGPLRLRPGDFLREEALREDVRRVQDQYGQIGFVEARIDPRERFVDEPGVVNITIQINEGPRSKFGRLTVRGNTNTKDEVVRRELRFYPGEDYDTVRARQAEQRLRETGLFSKATVTPLEDLEGEREALIEIEEADAIQFLVGVGVSTDSGVLGTFTLENRNFDLFDLPRTTGEFFRGQAFRGDGQRLRLQFEPGTELTRFRIDFTEPYFLDLPLRFDLSAYLFQRDRGPYQEQRIGIVPSLSRRFEGGILDQWALEGALRLEGVDIDDVDPFAARPIREVRGSSTLTSAKLTLVRDTTDSRLNPTEGYRFNVGWEQAGALGGDYTFSKPSAGITWYKTVRTDIFDRKSVLALRGDAAYIFGDAPVFERYYAGGFGSIRGFDFRGVSPRRGIQDDRVGGDFILLAGGEYSFPLYSDIVRGVTFVDMGTVERGFELTSWRVAVGFGLRVNVQFFGPVPLTFDFGFPIASDDEDDERVFNFSFGASF